MLRALGTRHQPLVTLAEDPRLRTIAGTVQGIDGRQARKLVMRALALRAESALDAGMLTFEDLSEAARQTAAQISREVSHVRAA